MQEYASPADRWAFLAPWSARLRDRDVRLKVQYANDHTYRSKFHAIELTLEDALADEREARELAEALELVATALAVCPDAWSTVLIDQCECTDYFNPQNEPLTVRVEIDCTMLSADDLALSTGQRFFHALMGDERAYGRSGAFQEAREQVHVLAGSVPCKFAPVAIAIRLTMGHGGVDEEASMALVGVLERYSCPGAGDSWCVLEAIDFDWTEPPLDDSIVDCARRLVAKQPLVQVSRVTIRPPEVRSSAAALSLFVATLVHAYPNLELELVDVGPRFAQAPGQQKCEASTRQAPQALACAGVSIKCLHVGVHPHSTRTSRRMVWEQLFGTLLHPLAASCIEHLVLSSHRLLEVEDDVSLIDVVAARCTGFRIPPTLTLSLTSANASSVHAIIRAFGAELQHLCIIDSHDPIPHETVAFIVRTCPILATLDLSNVALNSMDIFLHQQGRLSTLALTNVTLRHRRSILTFLTQLADARTSLGRHLGEFRLARAGDPAAMWDKIVLNSSEFDSLRRALQANDRLHTLYVEVEDETPHWVMSDLMLAHRKSVAVREAPLALTSKLAWLSATTSSPFSLSSCSPQHQLSHDVTRHVFEYAAECVQRWVYVGKSFDS